MFLTPVCLQAFRVVFQKAIERSEANEDVRLRVASLIDTITHSVFLYTTRGLFEKDKLIFAAQMTFQVSGDVYFSSKLYNIKFLTHGPLFNRLVIIRMMVVYVLDL